MTTYSELKILRPQWMPALGAIDRERVFVVAHALAQTYTIRPLAVPQAGLALLPLRETVERRVFYLGEIPMSMSHVELVAPDGTTVEGGAAIMADDAEFADALAVCDGVLAHDLPGAESVAALVRDGLEMLADRGRVRATMLHRSRVNFALLNEEDGDDTDAETEKVTA